VGDFRLMSRDVVENIKLMPERNLFMKGVLSWVGGRTDVVEYARAERVAGIPNSMDGSYGTWHLKDHQFLDLPAAHVDIYRIVRCRMSFLYGAWMIVDTLAFGNPVRGYTSILVSILFLGGVQLIGIGVLGEYIGRIYVEVKKDRVIF
jgi:hypothetical protein